MGTHEAYDSAPLLPDSPSPGHFHGRVPMHEVYSQWRHRVEIVACCLAYALVGPSVIMVNNHIIKKLRFPYPMTLSVLGLLTTAIVCTFVLRVLPRLQRLATVPSSSVTDPAATAPQISFRFWLTNMVPIGAAQGITFACGNAAYMYLTITFTQVRPVA